MRLENIKFRGIPVKAKEENFVEGDLIRTAEGKYFIFPEGVELGITNLIDGFSVYSGFGLLVEVKPDTVGQYTGIRDSSKKEIYEGDIIKFNDYVEIEMGGVLLLPPSNIALVEFTPENACFSFIFNPKNPVPLRRNVKQINFSVMEVIGNIYKNPELLEENHESNKETD